MPVPRKLFVLLLLSAFVAAQAPHILSRNNVAALLANSTLRPRAGDFIAHLGLSYKLSDAEKARIQSAATSGPDASQGGTSRLSREEFEAFIGTSDLRALVVPVLSMMNLTFDLDDTAEQSLSNAGLSATDLQSLWTRFQTSALGMTRSLNTAASTYAREYGNGFPATVANLGPPPKGAARSAQAADYLDAQLVSGHRRSYVLVYIAGGKNADGKIASYTFTARPSVWKPGRRSFFTDQSGVIHATGENRAATAQDPAI